MFVNPWDTRAGRVDLEIEDGEGLRLHGRRWVAERQTAEQILAMDPGDHSPVISVERDDLHHRHALLAKLTRCSSRTR